MDKMETTMPSYFDHRIADTNNHTHSRFSKLCAHLIKSTGREPNLNEMTKLYIEITEMKKAFDEDLWAIQHAITKKHDRPANFYNLKCFKYRSSRLWHLMNGSMDILMNSPKTQEDVIEEFISILNGEYADYLQEKENSTSTAHSANIQTAFRELNTELTNIYQSMPITSVKIG